MKYDYPKLYNELLDFYKNGFKWVACTSIYEVFMYTSKPKKDEDEFETGYDWYTSGEMAYVNEELKNYLINEWGLEGDIKPTKVKKILKFLKPIIKSERKEKQKDIDNVNHPSHYTYGGIETIDYMKAKATPEEFNGHLRLTALKYLSRAGHKDDTLQDYKKAQWYLNRLVKELEGEHSETTNY